MCLIQEDVLKSFKRMKNQVHGFLGVGLHGVSTVVHWVRTEFARGLHGIFFTRVVISVHTIPLYNTDKFELRVTDAGSSVFTDTIIRNAESCICNTESLCLYVRETRLYHARFCTCVIRLLKSAPGTEAKCVRE